VLTLEIFRSGSVASVIAVTTSSSAAPFLQELGTWYPSTALIGMLAPATPFSTGRPRTLFWQGQVLESGTVGVARIGEGPDIISLGWEGLVPVKESKVLVIDSWVAFLIS
jgi:small ligand-binding sensory domain FIST